MSSALVPNEKAGLVTWRGWLSEEGFAELYGIEEGKPHVFDQLEWLPGPADHVAAWEFYSQLRTRIATQPLTYRTGDEGTALESIYRLFELSRSSMNEHTGCTHFATLTTRVLNDRIRPFTARWHQIKTEGRLSSADVRFQFRRELAALQPNLRELTHLLALLAGEAPEIATAEAEVAAATTIPVPRFWDELPFGIGEGTRGLEAVRVQINEKEAEEVKARRGFYSLSNADRSTDAVGLSISGGGIRSATFALGVVQQLAGKGILCQVDFLSTVSGGGYLGAFISSFLGDAEERITLKPSPSALPFGASVGESQGVRQLRNHSKYLIEGGLETLATIFALVGYGVLTSVLLVSPFVLAAALVARVAFESAFRNPPGISHPSGPTIVLLVSLAVAVFVLPLIQNVARGNKLQLYWERTCVGLFVLSIILFGAEWTPSLIQQTFYIGGPGILFACVAALPIIFGAAGLTLGPRRGLGRFFLDLLTITGPALIVVSFLWLSNYTILAGTRPTIWVLATATAAIMFYSTFVLNINFASPHAFYRDRLVRTYLTRAIDGDTAVETCDPQPLSTMNAFGKAPYHLVNCAVNIPGCKDPNLRGRNADFFVFSKHFCGSPTTGMHQTTSWEKMDSHLDLGTAMAISGAAAAPHMGKLTSARYTFLLALLNIRLGYWLHKPEAGYDWPLARFRPPTGWYYFLLELTGLMSEKTSYLNLSDGGHIENLGIYELLRRRCKFVVAIDGEADPQRSFGGLLTLTQLAKIDLGVNIEPDLADLRMEKDGLGRSHFGLSRIDYPDGSHGLLLYIKSSLTGNESEFLRKYRVDNPDFPHQSTAQQIFSETQFEAYRVLGEHIAKDLFREDLVGQWDSAIGVSEWFRRLASHLLD